jgi:hypothetical protein
MASICALGALVLTPGCGGACSDAVDLCQECELVTDNCENLYADASSEFCEAAVEVYEASCAE